MSEHSCAWCPDAARALYAVAHNAVLAYDMTLAGMGDEERYRRKMAELRYYVMDVYRPEIDAHFDALEGK